MTDRLGRTLDVVPIDLIKNSVQQIALEFTAPTGASLDVSQTTVNIELDGPSTGSSDYTYTGALTATPNATGATSAIYTFTIDDSEATWPYDLYRGQIVSYVATDRVVIASLEVTVQGY